MEAEVFDGLQTLRGFLPMRRRRVIGAPDAVRLTLNAQHTVVRAQRIGAITVTRCRRGEAKQWPPPLVWRGPMRAKVSKPAFARRFGHRE